MCGSQPFEPTMYIVVEFSSLPIVNSQLWNESRKTRKSRFSKIFNFRKRESFSFQQ